MAPRLLATDLDGTFIGDTPAMMSLWAELDAAGVILAFSTGRHLPSIERFYAEVGTDRRARACVCLVGTEIWVAGAGGYVLDQGWSDHIAVGWDLAAVEDSLATIGGASRQEAEWQTPLKYSLYLDSDSDVTAELVRASLEESGVAAQVVYSAGRFLDVLPAGAGKGSAVLWLTDQLGIAPADVVTAGDSGNDLDMMRSDLGFRCIAVGNAADELRRVREPQIYHATANHAGGIREGLEHYGWLTP